MVIFSQCRSDLLLEDIPTSSLKGNYMVSHCACKEHDKYECHVPSLKLSYTYILWLKITNGATTLQSPLLLVTPINIGKC